MGSLERKNSNSSGVSHEEDLVLEEADPACIEWIKDRITVPGYSHDLWTEEMTVTSQEFITQPQSRRMVFWVTGDLKKKENLALHCSANVPSEKQLDNKELQFFVKEANSLVSVESIARVVQYGVLKGKAMESLLRLMSGVYVPIFLANQTWPDSIKKDFIAQMHKFMASLTESAYEAKGQTVLYIPNEDLSDPEKASKEKDLMQRLESTLIHWTRQIKEVLNQQDNSEHAEDSGPLAEIQFWKSRAVDLSGVSEQINREGVQQIVAVLDKSSYLQPFLSLSTKINDETRKANDNLKFLETLQEPCTELAAAHPKDIPALLPKLLNCARMIWGLSRYYNRPEDMTGLLRKISNEIIHRCRAAISLEEVWDGDVEAIMNTLQESISAGDSWKAIYKRTVDALAARSVRKWDFDESSIFAQIDAFVQRCKDLLEVCEGQIQFARKSAETAPGEKARLPAFGGTRGPEIAKSLLEIENSFRKQIHTLRSLEYDILDVKAPKWHDDFNTFKSGIKDLEVMMQNTINTAFESVSTVAHGVELLEAFQHLAKRESIKRSVEKQTAYVYGTYLNDLMAIKKEFDTMKKNPPIFREHPYSAGCAYWAKAMLESIEGPYKLLENARHYLPGNVKEADDSAHLHDSLVTVLNEYINTTHTNWVNSIDTSIGRKLEQFLMTRGEGNLLEVNFSKDFLRLFQEMHYWEKLHYEVPYSVSDIYQQREKLRIMRENVVLFVREYNSILESLTQEERRLFSQRVHQLDRKIYPGLTKLMWSSKGVVEYYITDWRKHARELQRLTSDFKNSHELILRTCRQLGNMLLVRIEKKKVYDEGEFERRQEEHREDARKRLQSMHETIKSTMQEQYDVFRNDGDEIRREWRTYVEKVDKMVEDSLRQTVKRSLQEISRAIVGDKRTEVVPIFKVCVVLENNGVYFKPSMMSQTTMVNSVSKELITTISVIPRLSVSLNQDDDKASMQASMQQTQSFYEIISNDEDILKILVHIMTGMSTNQENMNNYLQKWDKYKNIWDLDKDAFIRRYAKSNRSLNSFDQEINKYKENAHQIQNEETISNTNFNKIDCSLLKQALVNHCTGWQNKFTTLLNNNAVNELHSIREYFRTNSTKLQERVENLDMLGKSVNLLKKLQEDKQKTEDRFEPLSEMYKLLEKYEVNVKEEELERLASLTTEWQEFQEVMHTTQKDLDKAKSNFKTKLESNLEDFQKEIVSMREDFTLRGPYDNDVSVTEAFKQISGYRKQIDAFNRKQTQMKQGLEIFNIDEPPYKEKASTVKELDLLDQMWTIVKEWEESYNSWKFSKFSKLEPSDLEEQAGRFQKRVGRLGKECKLWNVWSSQKETIAKFMKTMPLISDLRNRAMRQRHWEQLMSEIGERFDPDGEDFTLDKVLSLNLDAYEETIAQLANSANKELAIEEGLKKIAENWKTVSLDIVPYKDQGHSKLRGTEDVFSALEDNQVGLSTMKASRFYLAFSEEVNHWEKTLAHVSETVEYLLQVQKQWMYLENIFVGSEDIQRQLPTESSMFMSVNSNWKWVMDEMKKDPIAVRATHIEGVLELLMEMNMKLEKIQKSLDQYLETKRMDFPRFYFLSNDDLLEILGQARDPMMVQPHLKKCFEAIKELKMEAPGREGRKHWEAVGMTSPEKEYMVFNQHVRIDGPPEVWLVSIENAMIAAVKRNVYQCYAANKGKKERWVKDWHGQCLITAGQIVWTNECTKALNEVMNGSKTALKQLRSKWKKYLEKLIDLVRGSIGPIDRMKTVALITIEVHARDVIDKMIKAGVSSPRDFDWLSQLRFIWEKDLEEVLCYQTNTTTNYGYEYEGNNGRLVITPLTDRCYMTLTTALFLRKGGNPQGPAGTGKTETVKDLGKAVAKYVIVFNCSDGLDYKSMGRFFSGLAQTGAWSCFDEFNRIDVEVLSVVAQQILSILSAIGELKDRFIFEGREIKLNRTCGIFVTMNPGYAGRAELPDNLKALLRPMSMMVPDSAMIAEIMLMAEGFLIAKQLSKKLVTLYQLAIQQLSKQDHYDFGLRNVKTILNYAGALKRAEPDMNEDILLLRALRDMNMPKFLAEDAKLFMALIGDIFPGIEPPVVDYGALQVAIETELKAHDPPLQLHPPIIKKTIQSYEARTTRHCNMLVGSTQAGKSTCWKVLSKALTRLHEEKAGEKYMPVSTHIINPKSLSVEELYGEFDLNTNEWTDGVLSVTMRNLCSDPSFDEKWIILDGPVDTLWIESMNTVMDDNKMLTLISGERISMPAQVTMFFEVRDLSVASPATVSRAGMVYLDLNEMGWRPYINSWLDRFTDADIREKINALLEKYVDKLLEWKRKECKDLIPIVDMNNIVTLTKMYDALATPAGGVDAKGDPENYQRMAELWFTFCLIWSIGGGLDDESRKKFDMAMREIEPQFPSKDLVYEYYVDTKAKGWKHWEEKVPQSWRPKPNAPFYKILVPTVDTVRYSFVVTKLVEEKQHTLVTGNTGTGKTFVIQDVLSKLDERRSVLMTAFSAQTSSIRVQEMFESRVEKRTKTTFAPPGGKKLVIYVDDMNMPQKDAFGSQPPLELMRHWIDYAFWYDRAKQTERRLVDIQLVASMGPPGGGRTMITERLQSRFCSMNFTFPSEATLKRIFGTMLQLKLADFDDEIRSLTEPLTQASIEIYRQVLEAFLPTPAKSHYVFNLRDLGKVFQGLLLADRNTYDTRESMLRLWVHESFRVFADRMTDDKDRNAFQNIIFDKLTGVFNCAWKQLFKTPKPSIFGDIMKCADEDAPPYEEYADRDSLKSFMEQSLDQYNLENSVQMNLVMFFDAIEHVCRIHRVIRQPRGNVLLIGMGGSGRQSLARLASFLAMMKTFQIEVTKNYRSLEFHDDLKKLFTMTGVEGKDTCFLFVDTQIVVESFLEDINGILTSGEVPNLFTNEELNPILDNLRKPFTQERPGEQDTPDALFNFFIERVRSHMHIILAMSPVGEAFRRRLRMFPALVNCTTIDWFSRWPNDALLEVALYFLSDVSMGSDEVKQNVAGVFATAHSSAHDFSEKMFNAEKRVNYVTPTNYLELVKGYRNLLAEKRKQIGDAAAKLRNGLDKLEETRVTVGEMSVQLEEKKIIVAKSQKDCEELLVVIVQERRSAEDQQKTVTAESEKIAKEEAECKVIADEAQADLDLALPALEAAQEALNALDKKDISEIKAYSKPPYQVELVLNAVMILLKTEPTWSEAKKQLGDPNFLGRLVNYDKDNMSDSLLNKIHKFTVLKDFDPEAVGKVSKAAKSLCLWVRAMEIYGKIAKEVAPKRARLNEAMRTLAKKQGELKVKKDKLQEVLDKVAELKAQYEDSVNKKETLRKESEELQNKLQRAEKLVEGLAGERSRWEANIEIYERDMGFLVGDCLVASAFLSYAGPFPTEYRDEMVNKFWLKQVRDLSVPSTANFSFAAFLSKPTDVRNWNLQGLPSDTFSTENGVLVTRGVRWPLMIDPQGQANKWVKKMEGAEIKAVDLKMADFMRVLESAIQFGMPVIMQDVLEELDPSLEPILSKAIIKKGNSLSIKLGDKEIDYSPDFKFYLTTKLANPHYSPEICVKTTIVNFAVKETGLEAQLLGRVVKKERPDLEESKNDLVVKVAEGKNKLVELEDEILRLLSTASGSLLDNVELVNTLQSSKTISEDVKAQLVVAEQTEKKIDIAREGYRPCAFRATIIYFVLNNLTKVDSMYQFSLDWYNDLFGQSIDRAPKSEDLAERINNINEFHTYFIYKMTCRALFERHKLLFSFQLTVKIMEGAKKINMDEYRFFLLGGNVLDKDTQPANPSPDWIDEMTWDNITELDKLPNFRNIVTSFEQNNRDWKQWFNSPEPDKSPLPGEWESKCNELQRLIFLRSLRRDRVIFASTSFIVTNMSQKYTEPPVLDLSSVLADSNNITPLIFVLSPGVDPTANLIQLAQSKNMSEKFRSIALGQGQSPKATTMIDEGIENGHWVLLANCHLMVSWLPTLEKIIESLPDRNPHPDFRLWLSSYPHPKFPIGILQNGSKMTTEPPKGLKANMSRMYNIVTESVFTKCKNPAKYKKLLCGLVFFHAVLLERRKFQTLGWNVLYDFNDSDFEFGEQILSVYLDEAKGEETPWDAIKYLIGEVCYGGRVTDDWDRRLLSTYMSTFCNDDAITEPNYRLSSLSTYYIPEDGSLSSYKEYINTLPPVDMPEAFGQHANADVSSQITETVNMLETIISLGGVSGGGGGGSGKSKDDTVHDLASDLQNVIPEPIDLELVMSNKADDPSALNIVLFQEIDRYNIMLRAIRANLALLKKAVKGLVVMSAELEEIYNALSDSRVPPPWLKGYPSLKPLGPWTRDLVVRVEQMKSWGEGMQPRVFWLGGFTYPTGFLTAVLQTSARKNNVAIDTLSWEFVVVPYEERDILQPPKEGVYIKNLYLEGAGWDSERFCLAEPQPMSLIANLPIFHFKPVESKKKAPKGVYNCPCYYYQVRTGSRERPSYMLTIDIKSGSSEPDHWIKRGTAVLLSTAS